MNIYSPTLTNVKTYVQHLTCCTILPPSIAVWMALLKTKDGYDLNTGTSQALESMVRKISPETLGQLL